MARAAMSRGGVVACHHLQVVESGINLYSAGLSRLACRFSSSTRRMAEADASRLKPADGVTGFLLHHLKVGGKQLPIQLRGKRYERTAERAGAGRRRSPIRLLIWRSMARCGEFIQLRGGTVLRTT
jgi:hypothetical protein